MDYKIQHLEKHNDYRGQLIVFLKKSCLHQKYKKFGQIYFVTFDKKGVVRGNHYHKKWREWFGVITGKLQVMLKDFKTGEVKKFILDGNSNKYIRLEIGPNIIHAFKSLSEKASLLNYASKPWSAKDDFSVKILS